MPNAECRMKAIRIATPTGSTKGFPPAGRGRCRPGPSTSSGQAGRPFLPQMRFQQPIGALAHFGGETMLAIRMRHLQVLRLPVKLINLSRRLHHGIDALPFEVGISHWCTDETHAWSQGADDFAEVER